MKPRVWISLDDENPTYCAVWVELGGNRMLWILGDGRHGVEDDKEYLDGEPLTERLNEQDEDWERIS